MAFFEKNRGTAVLPRKAGNRARFGEIEWHTGNATDAVSPEMATVEPVHAEWRAAVVAAKVRLGLADQWSRLMDIIRAFCLGARRAHAMHAEARTKLEVVEFSIENIFDDIASIVQPTAAMVAVRLRAAGGIQLRAPA